MSQQADKETENYLKERKQEFEWLKKTILQRGDTILRVAQVIVSRQKLSLSTRNVQSSLLR